MCMMLSLSFFLSFFFFFFLFFFFLSFVGVLMCGMLQGTHFEIKSMFVLLYYVVLLPFLYTSLTFSLKTNELCWEGTACLLTSFLDLNHTVLDQFGFFYLFFILLPNQRTWHLFFKRSDTWPNSTWIKIYLL